MALTLQSLTPLVVSSDGGQPLYLAGVFDAARTYTVTCGGANALSGIPGQASKLFSPDGAGIACFTPVLAGSGPFDVTVTDDLGATSALPAALEARAPFFASEVFSLRSILPPLYDTGPRNFSEIPAVDT